MDLVFYKQIKTLEKKKEFAYAKRLRKCQLYVMRENSIKTEWGAITDPLIRTNAPTGTEQALHYREHLKKLAASIPH